MGEIKDKEIQRLENENMMLREKNITLINET